MTVHAWVPILAAGRAGCVPVFGCIVVTHAAKPSSPALRVAARVLSDQGLTAPHAGAGSCLVSHTTRPDRAKEDTMNRWTGTGHLTKDPKFLQTDNGTAICTLRIAVKRAGKQGQDGYFDVKCFEAQANACAQDLEPPTSLGSVPTIAAGPVQTIVLRVGGLREIGQHPTTDG